MKLHSNIYGWEYVWEEFAEEKGGKAIKNASEIEGQDGQVSALHIPIEEGAHALTVAASTSGTSMLVSYPASDDFSMRIFIDNPIHKIEKVFGMQDIKIGDARFDNKFVIQSNHPNQIARLLGNAELREAIFASPITEIRTFDRTTGFDHRWHVPANHNVLAFELSVFLDKYDQLEAIYKILAALLIEFKDCDIVGTHKAPAEVADTTEPQKVSGRLHSPLLDRK